MAHHCFRYFSMRALASALPKHRYRVTQRYSVLRWLSASSSPGNVDEGKPEIVEVQRNWSPSIGTSPGVKGMSGRIASRYIGVSGARTGWRWVETVLCRYESVCSSSSKPTSGKTDRRMSAISATLF